MLSGWLDFIALLVIQRKHGTSKILQKPLFKQKQKPKVDPKREPSRNRLLAHERRFECKDPSESRPRRYPIRVLKRDKPEPPPDPVEDMYDCSTEDWDSEGNEEENIKTEIKPEPKPKKKTVGIFFYKKHGYGYAKGKSPDKPIRNFKCPDCQVTKTSRSAINAHYRHTHPPLVCSICGDTFNTPATLDQHQHYHIHPLQFPCRHAGWGKCFPFASDLNHHSLVHSSSADYVCMATNCGKLFQSRNALIKHA